jgi:hypothetical protein
MSLINGLGNIVFDKSGRITSVYPFKGTLLHIADKLITCSNKTVFIVYSRILDPNSQPRNIQLEQTTGQIIPIYLH